MGERYVLQGDRVYDTKENFLWPNRADKVLCRLLNKFDPGYTHKDVVELMDILGSILGNECISFPDKERAEKILERLEGVE